MEDHIIKVNAHGNKVWSKIIEGIDYGYAVKETSDGGFIITGFTDTNSQDMYLLKLDSLGNAPTIATK